MDWWNFAGAVIIGCIVGGMITYCAVILWTGGIWQ